MLRDMPTTNELNTFGQMSLMEFLSSATLMKDYKLLDPFNEIDIAAFHYIFISLIKNKLDAWRHAWSKHRIRTIKTSLIRLWVPRQINCPTDDLTVDEVLNFGVEGLISEDVQID